MTEDDDNLPPAVRVLPMSDRIEGFVGQSIERVQADYFLGTLRRRGKFRYCRSGLRSPAGTMVLFQFKARVVACAALAADVRYDEPRDGFAGELRFDRATVRAIEPWDADRMRTAWPTFGTFGHAKFRLNPAGWRAFERALRDVRPARCS